MKTRKALIEENEKLKEENERLKRNNKYLVDTVNKSKAKAEALQEQLEKASRGERCYGGFCAQCKHAIEADRVNIRMENGQLIPFGNYEIICALSVPCSDFQQKGE